MLTAEQLAGTARGQNIYAVETSADGGAYEIRGLRGGAYNITVRSDAGDAPKDGWHVEVGTAATVEKDLVLEDGGSVDGTVADSEGTPIASTRIELRSSDDWSAGEGARSNASGHFTIDNVRPGKYLVVASRGLWSGELRKPGSTDDAKQGETVVVRAGQTTNVRLVVESMVGTISGDVVGVDGAPITDAFVVSARESDAAGATRSQVTETRWDGDDDKPVVTDTTGAFTLTKLSPGTYTVRAFRKGGAEAYVEHVAIGGTAHPPDHADRLDRRQGAPRRRQRARTARVRRRRPHDRLPPR